MTPVKESENEVTVSVHPTESKQQRLESRTKERIYEPSVKTFKEDEIIEAQTKK